MENVEREKLVKSLYKSLFPKYITDFMKPDVNVRPGLNSSCLDYPYMLRKFGADDITNIVPACMNCNRRKRTKSAEQFLLELGRH